MYSVNINWVQPTESGLYIYYLLNNLSHLSSPQNNILYASSFLRFHQCNSCNYREKIQANEKVDELKSILDGDLLLSRAWEDNIWLSIICLRSSASLNIYMFQSKTRVTSKIQIYIQLKWHQGYTHTFWHLLVLSLDLDSADCLASPAI